MQGVVVIAAGACAGIVLTAVRVKNPMGHGACLIAVKAMPGILVGLVLATGIGTCVSIGVTSLAVSWGYPIRSEAVPVLQAALGLAFVLPFGAFALLAQLVDRFTSKAIKVETLARLSESIYHFAFNYIANVVGREDRKAKQAINHDFPAPHAPINRLFEMSKSDISKSHAVRASSPEQEQVARGIVKTTFVPTKVGFLLRHHTKRQCESNLADLRERPEAYMPQWDGREHRSRLNQRNDSGRRFYEQCEVPPAPSSASRD